MQKQQFKPTVTKEGQTYVDDPVYVKAKPISTLEYSLASAFGRPLNREEILVGYERVKLKWIKPKGK